ncbi:SNF2 family DNA-dependent ATPase [Auriculariales sp. MPI-PUGE-AT-0066]|nr:SNF2 family DNA-dependent ATPase [Auriculariales sp. MPI-PUGE-AT-0066]
MRHPPVAYQQPGEPYAHQYERNGHYSQHEHQDHYRHSAHDTSEPHAQRDSRESRDHRPPQPGPPVHSKQRYVRGGSPDLDDYPEVWESALSAYAAENQARKHHLDRYFQEQVIVRDARAAQENVSRYTNFLHHVARKYSARARHHQHLVHGDGVADSRKRPLGEPVDRLAELDPAPSKRRRVDDGSALPVGHYDEDEDVYDDDSKAARKLKTVHQLSDDALSTRETTPRRRNGKQPEATSDGLNSPSLPGTPSGAILFGLDDEVLPLSHDVVAEGDAATRRVLTVEENQRKVWRRIVFKDVPRVGSLSLFLSAFKDTKLTELHQAYRNYNQGLNAKASQLKRISHLCSSVVRKPNPRNPKIEKERAARAKKMMREMMLFWKKNDKDEREGRRQAEREALLRMRQEEEQREAARQARKLEFLISQTEIYSHFIGHKLPMALLGPDLDQAMGEVGPLDDLDYDNTDQTNLHRHAAKNAQRAVIKAKQQAHAFDRQSVLDRKVAEAKGKKRALDGDEEDEEMEDFGEDGDGEGNANSKPLVDLDSEELNFQNPTLLGDTLTYQLKGLNWLVNLYEQGINGILADEMGLGKTVQSISLIAYLAEKHNIWGPFLVIAPASTLHNWQQELSRFVPHLRALPYWGTVKDRTTLRKIWLKKDLTYDQDSQYHVIISSYPIVVQDAQYFQRVKWQYMILDEAQAIKNSASGRWKTTLGFHCRNRLLLTGTPIQNSMHELWALLHFIMPSLFDSHEEFNDWFSKDADGSSDKNGSGGLNEHQVKRLHMILKPFMLRRVKKHVQNELGEKIEIDVMCNLTPRQRNMYREVRANLRVTNLGSQGTNADSAYLANLVMQFRKVCNHPELFQRAEVKSALSVSRWARSGNLAREGDFLPLPYSTRNPIDYVIPRLFYEDGGLLDVPHETGPKGFETRWLHNLMNIWSSDWMHRSLHDTPNSSFSFLRLTQHTATEARDIFRTTTLKRLLLACLATLSHAENGAIQSDTYFAVSVTSLLPCLPQSPVNNYLEVADGLPALCNISSTSWQATPLSRSALRWYAPRAAAPPIVLDCSNRTFAERQASFMESPQEALAFYGPPHALQEDPLSVAKFQDTFPGVPPTGLFAASPANQLPWSSTHVPEAKRLIYDSAKLMKLDSMLHDLKLGGHKVLIYFQMTKMIDLMEEYLVFRQYKYLRLDGSSKLEDRRDMVTDWQTRPDIFIFLLSTRAGGLGINLTAADTVIFYDHDWNPSNDAQAMDRAHRLGQTRQVTVYRLITKGTIDERIIQLARVKKDVSSPSFSVTPILTLLCRCKTLLSATNSYMRRSKQRWHKCYSRTN